MLTLKGPIQLHIALGLTGNAESFGERIRGNYGLLGARFSAKDLLFLMTAPPELPEDLGGMTTLVNQQSRVDVQSVTMEVINNVVNRILLDGTEQFTYQDQVYITTVLNRLGITNAAQFMEQVRQLRIENESTVHMTKLYREEMARILQRRAAGEPSPPLPLPAEKEEETPARALDPRVTLCMEILNRLETANLYETVHAFQRSWTDGASFIRNQELRLAEQLRFSNAVSLAEIKQQVYQQPNLHLLHHLNAYETGGLLETPKDEAEVLSHAAAASLMSAVDSTVVEVLNRPSLRREQWVQVKNALWQAAENTLSRFETYHSRPQPPAVLSERTETAWNNYLQELREYQSLYRQMYPKAADTLPPPPGRGESGGVFLTHLTESGGTEETLSERSSVFRETDTEKRRAERVLREDRQQILRESAQAGVRPSGQTAAPDGETLHLTYRSENREGDQIQYPARTEILPSHGQPPAEAAEQAEIPEGRITGEERPAERETVLRRETERRLSGEEPQHLIRRQLSQGGIVPPAASPGEVSLIPAPGGEEPGGEETGIPERFVPERSEQENLSIYEHSQESRQRTLRQLLRTFGAIPGGGTTVLPGETGSVIRWNQIREGDLIHRWETGERLTAEEQAAVKALREILELQRMWPPKPSVRTVTLRRENAYRERERTVREMRETAEPPPPLRQRTETAGKTPERPAGWPTLLWEYSPLLPVRRRPRTPHSSCAARNAGRSFWM